MKILIISDSHGNVANLKHIMGFAKKFSVGAIIHAGDWDNVKSLETVLSYKLPVYAVLGNADVSDDLIQNLKVKSQKYNSKYLIFELGGKRIGITHKSSDNKKYFNGEKLDIIFNGHLHSKFDGKWNGIEVARAGAVIGGINFAVYDTTSGKIDFVNEQT